MFTIIILVLVGCFTGVYLTHKSEDWDNIDMFFRCFFGGIMGFFAGVVIALIIPSEIKERQSFMPIVSLQDNTNVSGSFFLGCGTIREDFIYVFYTQKDDGSFILTKVKANEAVIKYTDSLPRLVVIEKYCTDALVNNFSIAYHDVKPEKYRYHYIIEVPKGTIKNNYVLDAN